MSDTKLTLFINILGADSDSDGDGGVSNLKEF